MLSAAPTPVPPCSGCFYGEPAFSGGNGYRAVILVGTFTEAALASGLGSQIGQLAQDGVQHCPLQSCPPWGEGGGYRTAVPGNSLSLLAPDDRIGSKEEETYEI